MGIMADVDECRHEVASFPEFYGHRKRMVCKRRRHEHKVLKANQPILSQILPALNLKYKF